MSVLVPVLDERDSLPQLVDEVRSALDGGAEGADPLAGGWELLFVDDGSTDGSWQIMKELATEDRRVRAIRLRRNFGKSAALAAALAEARGEVIATLDGDLQDDPAELPSMLALLQDSADLVTGYKHERKDPLSKRLPSKLFNWVTGVVSGLKVHDHNCGLKVARREVFDSLPLYGDMHRYIPALSHAQGFRVVEQKVNHRPRRHGRSKFGLERYLRGALDLLTMVTLTRYRHRPAHLFGGLGLLLGLIGGAILVYLMVMRLVADATIGDRPLLLLGVLLAVLSVQLSSLGLVAELLVTQQAARDDPRRHVIARTADPPPPEAPDLDLRDEVLTRDPRSVE